MESFLQDLRYALRQLRRRPGFTAVAVATLALGVGANTGVFSVVNGVLLRALPFPDGDRLVRVYEQSDGLNSSVSPANFADWRSEIASFDGLSAYHRQQLTLTGAGEPYALPAVRATSGFFGVLGVSPVMGRDLVRDDEVPGQDRVVVLSDGLWRGRFAADPGILTKSVTLDGETYQVIGVAVPGFEYPVGTQVWLPRNFTPGDLTNRGSHHLSVVGRIRADVPRERAVADVKTIARRLELAYPANNSGVTAGVVDLKESIVGPVGTPLRLMLAAVTLVLIIACANVANLSLVRSIARQSELLIRTALGAGRKRVMSAMLAESMLLALAGGAAGLVLAVFGTELLVTAQAGNLPRLGEVRVDWTVLVYTLGLSLLTGAGCGMIPALRASGGADLSGALREAGRGQLGNRGARRVRSGLVVAQLALAIVLLGGAGLVIRSFGRLTRVDPGFRPEGVATFGVSLPDLRYPTPDHRRQFVTEALRRVQALPGVNRASAVSGLPFTGLSYRISVESLDGRPAADRPEDTKIVEVRVVTPEYFRALGIRMVSGRAFEDRDRGGAPLVAVVDQRAAELLWPGAEPLGRAVEVGTRLGYRRPAPRAGGEIVGVVSDVRELGFDADLEPHVYVAYDQFPVEDVMLAVQTAGDPGALFHPVTGVIRALDPLHAVPVLRTMADVVSQSVAQPRFYLVLLSGFAVVALLLAAIGLYGVIAYSVGQRTRELGIRMALGARRPDVVRLVLRSGLVMVLAGGVLGLVGTIATTRLLRVILFEVDPLDPLALAAGTLVLVAVSLVATYVPAWRAARIDPVTALRTESE